VHNKHDLEFEKIVTTITDNASNFAKAFSEYMVVADDPEMTADEEEIETGASNDNIDTVTRQQNQTELVLEDIGEILANPDETSTQLQLPLHTRCVAHSLNLIATKDAEEALKSPPYSRLHHACMGKCQAMWNAVNRSSKAADKVAEICINKKLLVPGQTRWNARYDAICRIIELKDKLSQIADALQLPKFARNEIDFLTEYKYVMEPLAVTLDQLQGDKDCYYGMMLPKLTQLRHKLQKMQSENSMLLCGPLVSALLTGLAKRFEKFFALNVTEPSVREAVLAAVSHPAYKMKWVSPNERESVTQLLVSAATRIADQASGPAADAEVQGTLASSDDDYGYGETSVASPGNNSIQMQVRIRSMPNMDS
jgi:hypothetical protein